MADLSGYLHRVSFLLRRGEPVADIAVYAPTGDARAAMRPGAGAYLNLWSAVNSALPPSLVPTILDSGYSFDAIDDGTLGEAQSRGYKAIVERGGDRVCERSARRRAMGAALSRRDHGVPAQRIE